MELERIISMLRNTDEYRRRTFTIENENNKVFLRPTVGDTSRKFYSFEALQHYVRREGIHTNLIFDASRDLFSDAQDRRVRGTQLFPTTGGRPYEELEELAKALQRDPRFADFVVHRTSYGLENVEQLRHQYERGGVTYGVQFPTQTSTSFVRIMDRTGGREWTQQEIIKFWDENGIRFNDPFNDKFVKRSSSFMSPRFSVTQDRLLKVGVYDPFIEMERRGVFNDELKNDISSKFLATHNRPITPAELRAELQEHAKHASDGQYFATERAVTDLRDAALERSRVAKRQAAELRRRAGATISPTYHDLRRQADELDRVAELNMEHVRDLNSVIKNRTGIFQGRQMGLDLSVLGDVSDEFKEAYKKLTAGPGGHFLKGNLTITENPAHEGYDFVTSRYNLSRQVSTHGRSFSYIERMPEPDIAKMDIQAAVSLQELWDIPGMQAEVEAQTERMMQQMRETGKLPQDLYDALAHDIRDKQAMIDRMNPMAEEFEIHRLEDQVAYGQRLLAAVKGDRRITDDPGLVREVVKSYRESLIRRKGSREFPNFDAPDAIRAENSTAHMIAYGSADPSSFVPMDINEIRLDKKTGTWVMSDVAARRSFYAHGGFDLDDAFVMMARWNDETQRIDLLGYRNPVARAELHRYQIKAEDYGVDMIMKKRLARGRMTQEQYDAFRAVIDSRDQGAIRNWMRSNLLAVPANIGPTQGYRGDEYLGHDPRLGVEEGIEYELLERTEEQDRIAREHVEFLKGLRETDPEEWNKLLSAELWAKTERSAANKVIGTWTNSATFFNDWFARAAEPLRQAGFADDVLDQMTKMFITEDVIEMGALATKGGDAATARAATKISEVARMATISRALADAAGLAEDHPLRTAIKVDPYAKRHMGFDMDSWERGLTEGNRWVQANIPGAEFIQTGDLLLSEEEIAAGHGILSQGARAKDAVQEHITNVSEDITTRYPDFITRADVSDVDSEARWFIDQYRASRRIHGLDDIDEAVLNGLTNKRMYERAVHHDTLIAATRFFEDGVAGEHLARILTRVKQLIQDAPPGSYGPDFGMLNQFIGMDDDVNVQAFSNMATDWAATGAVPAQEQAAVALANMDLSKEEQIPLPRVYTMDDVIETTRRASPFDTRLHAHLDDILGGAPGAIDRRVLENLNYAVQDMGDFDMTQVPEVDELFAARPGRARMLMTGAQGPMNPRATVESAQGIFSMDDLWRRSMAGDSAASQAIREATEDYYQNMLNLVGRRPELDRDLTNMMQYTEDIRAGVPGAEKAANQRRLLEEAGEVAGGGYKRFGAEAVSRLWNAKYGKHGLLAAAAFTSIGIIHAIRNKDHTINDMQGPAFLPGGNPYDEENSMQFAPMNTSMYDAPQRGGTTYQVNLRGAQDTELVQAIAGIIGNDDVRSNKYQSRGRPKNNAYQQASERYS